MAIDWLDGPVRAALEGKREELQKQIKQLDDLLGGVAAPAPAPAGRLALAHDHAPAPVRAGRKPLTDAQKKNLSRRMRAVWAQRKANGPA